MGRRGYATNSDYYFITPTETVYVVGLEQTFYRVSEDVGQVELCVNVSSPIIECPITFPFQVSLTTRSRTAGNAIYNYTSFHIIIIL